jgi:hypothetical protein
MNDQFDFFRKHAAARQGVDIQAATPEPEPRVKYPAVTFVPLAIGILAGLFTVFVYAVLLSSSSGPIFNAAKKIEGFATVIFFVNAAGVVAGLAAVFLSNRKKYPIIGAILCFVVGFPLLGIHLDFWNSVVASTPEVEPGYGSILADAQGQPSGAILGVVLVKNSRSDRDFVSPSYPQGTVKKGAKIVEVSGAVLNTDPQNNAIVLYAEGYDQSGRQVAWTLDGLGQILLRLETGQSGDFTLHLNTDEYLKTIWIFASSYNVILPTESLASVGTELPDVIQHQM